MRVVDQLEIFEREIVDFRPLLVQFEVGERMWISCQLLAQGLHMVRVDVSIAKGMDEFTAFESADLR